MKHSSHKVQVRASGNVIRLERLTPLNDGVRRRMPPARRVIRPAKGGGYRRHGRNRHGE